MHAGILRTMGLNLWSLPKRMDPHRWRGLERDHSRVQFAQILGMVERSS